MGVFIIQKSEKNQTNIVVFSSYFFFLDFTEFCHHAVRKNIAMRFCSSASGIIAIIDARVCHASTKARISIRLHFWFWLFCLGLFFIFYLLFFISHIILAFFRDLSSTGSTLYETNLEEVWLDDILYGRDFFTDHLSKRRESDWPTRECVT